MKFSFKKRTFNLLLPKMLDFVAKQAGWKNWNSIKIENEAHARILIDEEKMRNNKQT